ncbi:unnamed protein product [Symbiodinium sp. CCMP2592]|nr:unnamed protein product [Symbiodinium sp. CCMP2592]
MLWESGIQYRKRYTAAPRLMAELTGAAKRLVAGKPAEEVAFAGGVRHVLDYLRKSLGKPKVNEVTDFLGKYFNGTRRRTGESMNDYVTRKSEAFLRVSQALRRVQPHYKKTKVETYGGNHYTTPCRWSRRSSDASGFWGSGGWGRQTTAHEKGEDRAGEGRPRLVWFLLVPTCLAILWVVLDECLREDFDDVGVMQIHSLECGNGPILLSVDALRSLGAVVDFAHDMMVLTKLDSTKIIPLHRSATGHQLLSLTEDLFSNAYVSAIPVPDLKHYVSH